MKKQIFYKWLKDNRVSTHQDFTWPEPGDWLTIEGELQACHNGLHVMEVQNLWEWYQEGCTLWEIQIKGEHFTHNAEKEICRKAKLTRCLGKPDDRMLRLLACYIAETVLPIFEKERPDDKRPRQAIEVARRHARGEATDEERAAAWAAAWAAAGAAAGDAARAAARAAAWDAAWAAQSGIIRRYLLKCEN